MAPEHTIAQDRLPGLNNDKDRLTYLAWVNATGTDKMPLMCIGRAWKPRCCSKQTGQQLGFDHHATRKSWMTTELFVSWLYRFSSFVPKSNPQKRMILLLGNCSAHGSTESLPNLCNADYQFLPTNTMSRLQPLDAGIIAALKARFREKQYDHEIDCIDAGAAEIYKTDQLTAVRWMQDYWDSTRLKRLKQ